jgi:hypothetical protein
VEGLTLVHNDLTGIQGGTTDEYFHLTQSQFADYIGRTEVAEVSGYLQSQIDTVDVTPDELGTGTVLITSNETIHPSVDQTFSLGISGYSWENLWLGGSELTVEDGTFYVDGVEVKGSGGGSGGQILQGSVGCNIGQHIYVITHDSVDIDESKPVVSMTVPGSGSFLYVQGIYDRTPGSFKVVLSGSPATSGYEINWLMGVSVDSGTHQGLELCNTVDEVYTITHEEIDTNVVHPQATLVAPTSGDTFLSSYITNINSTSFDVVLSGVPSVSGYYISWLLVTGGINNDEIEINVKNFGAKGDGITDDTVAIQSAIDAATNVTNTIVDPSVTKPLKCGGIVNIPLGVYKVSSLNIPSGVSLVGHGSITSVLQVSGSVMWKRNISTAFDTAWNVNLSKLQIRGETGNETLLTGAPYDGSGGKGWDIDIPVEMILDNVQFSNAYEGIRLEAGWNNTIRDCAFQAVDIGINIQPTHKPLEPAILPFVRPGDNLIERCQFNDTKISIVLRYALGTRVLNCAGYKASITHILILDGTDGNQIIGGRCEATGLRGAMVWGGSHVNHDDTLYRCIESHTSSTSAEPGSGAAWSTYWEEVTDYDELYIKTEWDTGINYTNYDAIANIFRDVGFLRGTNPEVWRDTTFNRDANWSFIENDADQYTLVENCYSVNYLDYNFRVGPLSRSSRFIRNHSATTSIVSGSPSILEIGQNFDDSYEKYIRGGPRFGKVVDFAGLNKKSTQVDGLDPAASYIGEVIRVDETNGCVQAPRNGGTVTLNAATQTNVTVYHVSSDASVVMFPKNATAATAMASGNVYADVFANDKIRITHTAGDAGAEFYWMIM